MRQQDRLQRRPPENPIYRRSQRRRLCQGTKCLYVVSAGDHRRFTVSLAPTGEARTEDTEVTEDFLVIDEPLPCRFSPTKLPRRPFSVFPDLRDLRVLRASLLRW